MELQLHGWDMGDLWKGQPRVGEWDRAGVGDPGAGLILGLEGDPWASAWGRGGG